MELEKQVCSLELSQRLKELGVPQESLYGHYHNKLRVKNFITERYYISNEDEASFLCSAFTVAELGEMLPPLYISMKTRRSGWCVCPKTVADERSDFEDERIVRADTEANARAKMLIYLIENNLLDPKTLSV